jgi:hypothetical protein
MISPSTKRQGDNLTGRAQERSPSHTSSAVSTRPSSQGRIPSIVSRRDHSNWSGRPRARRQAAQNNHDRSAGRTWMRGIRGLPQAHGSTTSALPGSTGLATITPIHAGRVILFPMVEEGSRCLQIVPTSPPQLRSGCVSSRQAISSEGRNGSYSSQPCLPLSGERHSGRTHQENANAVWLLAGYTETYPSAASRGTKWPIEQRPPQAA